MITPKITLLLLATVLADSDFGPRILGGEVAERKQFPFIVSLNLMKNGNEFHFCGGSIIHKRWVLTAAHCFDAYSRKHRRGIYVRAGTNSLHSGRIYDTSLIKIHPQYKVFAQGVINDIALVQIRGEFIFGKSTRKIGIGGAESPDRCTVIGWGTTDNEEYVTDLQLLNVRIQPKEKCYDRYRGPEFICAAGPKKTGPCAGDSGGPLVCGGKLVGVVSFGIVHCGSNYPDVFARARHYRHWIDSVVYG